MVETRFEIGELIENRYCVLDVIGKGGMGTLYRVADDAQDGDVVALKMVRLEGAGERHERVEYFRREFQLLTQLRHPNLVSVYDYGIMIEGGLYFTMEWIEGQDLELYGRQLTPGDSVPIIVQVCRALAYLHSRGVIHGDLKPANVLMVDGQIKIVDFGIALEIRSPEARTCYYSPGYSAPEMKESRPVDHRADLYSLGALWYVLLVGEAPEFMFGAEHLIRLMLREALKGLDWVNIGNVIAQLLAIAPEKRYASANEVIEAINRGMGSTYALETRETAESYALRTRFVNREGEIEMLQALWEQAQSDTGKLILISGESGVGKSRLVIELEVKAELEGARVVWGQCVKRGGSAYQPWREALRVLVRYVEGASTKTMQQVGPVLTALLPELWEREYMAGLTPPADLEPQAARLRLNNAIASVMRAAACLRPTVIVIENVHWAEEATLEMLGFLARVSVPKGLLVCATYRSDEIGPENPLLSLSGDQVQRIPLQTLSTDVTADLVRSMLGLEQVPALLMERVQQTTGGNAFFVQELIRSLAAEGQVLRRTVAGWQVDGQALQKAKLPESIRQVVERRLVQLSDEARETLAWAAVVGLVFWEGSIAQVGRVPRAQVRAVLGDLAEQGLVAVRNETAFVGEPEYLFLNPTVREVGYESIPREARREHHGQVAAWLLDHSDAEVDQHLGLVADHLERAGQIEQAVVYLRQAGEQAAERFANVEVVRYLIRALDLAPQDEQVLRYNLLLVREKVYDLQGAREEQDQDLVALEKLAQALDDNGLRAEVALRRAHYAEATSDYVAAIAAAQSAIDLAQAVEDVSREALGCQRLGVALWRRGDYEASRARLEQGLKLARLVGLRQVEADSLRNLGIVSEYQGKYTEARAYYGQALHICREIGDRRGESESLNDLGVVFYFQVELVEAKTCFDQALHLCHEIGNRRREGVVLLNLGLVFTHLGYYDKARTYLEQGISVSHEVGGRGLEGYTMANLALLFHQLGDDGAAWEHSQEALRIVQETGDRRYQGYALTNLGHALAGLGRMQQAANYYQRAYTLRCELGEHSLAMEPLAGLARIRLAEGNLSQARAHVEKILSHLESHTLGGTEEPFRVYLTCIRILRASQEPRAQDVLDKAHRLLQEQAAKITDLEMRRSFLKNVVTRQEILYEFAQSKRARK
ncbi:MAG: tetratricopeptide repeat protein [Chloroflexi bacterium]|nr:tetratricopeptide repeat protein [Chloroflexota bacterium]